MAILFALFGRIRQIVASYITTNSEAPFAIPFITDTSTSIYFMPLVYFIILGCVALIGYFCWQSYRQEIHEEKLQEKVAAKDDNLSSNNLAWVNILVNWAYMKCAPDVPKAIERWMEDINFTLAKNQGTIKILVNGIQEGSIPPWLRMIGQPQKKQGNIEVPVFLDAEEFGFTVSLQEEDKGKVITSTYTASVSEFKCWYNITLSCKDGQDFLVKFDLDTNQPYYVKINMKQKSDHKITTTVPEVVADIIKIGVLNTPFYFNLSTWGPVTVNPTTQRARKPSRHEKKHKKDNDGNAVNSKTRKTISERVETAGNNVENTPKKKTPPAVASSPDAFLLAAVDDDDSVSRKSNTLPSGTSRTVSDRLKSNQAQGLSGSLGSLVGIKRTPSGTGPAKPIRSREKRMIIKVLKTTGLSNDGSVYCRATLDFPHQKCKTKAVQSESNMSWPEDKLTFDLSSRSSEVKLILKKKINGEDRQRQESTIASAVLYLDRIDIDKPVEMSIPLRTAKKGNAEITVQLDFTENPDDRKFSSPRRSLDLSFVSDHMPPLDEKGNIESKSLASTMSTYSSDNNMPATGSTTVRTTTTKKSSPKRKSTGKGIPISHSAPNIQQKADLDSKSDVETIEGSVAETALKDLSGKVEIEKQSPQTASNIKKGKANLENDSFIEEHTAVNGTEEVSSVTDVKIERKDEMYYSTNSLHTAQETNGSGKVAVSTNPVLGKPATKPKKSRRTDERTKSLVSGIKAEDLPGNGEDKEWPKVRRSRSLVLNKGKKKHHKTGSATDLHKHQSGKEGSVYEEESLVSIPENDLQKNSKKKKSKSITKIFSKLGRKPSTKKQRKAIQETDVEHGLLGDHSEISVAETSEPSINKHSLSTASPSSETPPNSDAGGSEGDSSILEMTSPSELSGSTSLHSSLNGDKGVKRSKSLRTRLFGGKRKSAKN